MDHTLNKVVSSLQSKMQKTHLEGVLDILQEGMDIVEAVMKETESGGSKLDLLRLAITQVAKGRDGQLGTPDDTISRDTLRKLNIVLDSMGLFEDLVAYLVRLHKKYPQCWTKMFACGGC